MKMKVQAQHLQPGDIMGSGEVVSGVTTSSTKFASNKVMVNLDSRNSAIFKKVSKLWGKYTMINIERPEKVNND